MVFRRIYGEEIERLSISEIDDDFKRQLAKLKGQLSVHKGAAAEYRVRYRLLVASLSGATLADVVHNDSQDLVSSPAAALGPFTLIRKARFYVDQETSVEIDLHAVHENETGTDLMIEVKDWQREPAADAVRRFIQAKELLAGRLERDTVFLFSSESGLGEEAAAKLRDARILVLEAKELGRFEASSGL